MCADRDGGGDDQQVRTAARAPRSCDHHKRGCNQQRGHQRSCLRRHGERRDHPGAAHRRDTEASGGGGLGKCDPRPDPHHEQARGGVDVPDRLVEPPQQVSAASTSGGEHDRKNDACQQRRRAKDQHHRARRASLADRQHPDAEDREIERQLVGAGPRGVTGLSPEDRSEAERQQQHQTGRRKGSRTG